MQHAIKKLHMQRSRKMESEIKIFKKQAIEIDPENDSDFAVRTQF